MCMVLVSGVHFSYYFLATLYTFTEIMSYYKFSHL